MAGPKPRLFIALIHKAFASAPFPSPRAEHDAAPLIRAAPWMGQAAAVVEDPHDAVKVLRSRARIEFEPVQRFQHELPFDSAVAPLPALLALPQAKPGTRGQDGEPMQILLAPKDLRKPDDLLDEICCLAARSVSISRQLSAESLVSGRSRDALSIKTSFKGSLFNLFSARRNIGLTVFQHPSGTPPRIRRNPLKSHIKMRHRWGPDRCRSGPHLHSRFHCYINVLDAISHGVLLGC